MSCCVVPRRAVSYDVLCIVPCRAVPCRVVSCQVTWRRVASRRVLSCIVLYCIAVFRVASRRVALCRVATCCIASHRIMSTTSMVYYITRLSIMRVYHTDHATSCMLDHTPRITHSDPMYHALYVTHYDGGILCTTQAIVCYVISPIIHKLMGTYVMSCHAMP